MLAQALLGPTLPEKCAECGKVFPTSEWDVGGWSPGELTTDPDQLGGQIVGGIDDDPNARDTSVVDTRNAVLMESWTAASAEMSDDRHMVALAIEGRINQSSRRARLLLLIDVGGSAAFAAEIVGLAMRMRPDDRDEFGVVMNEQLDKLRALADRGGKPE